MTLAFLPQFFFRYLEAKCGVVQNPVDSVLRGGDLTYDRDAEVINVRNVGVAHLPAIDCYRDFLLTFHFRPTQVIAKLHETTISASSQPMARKIVIISWLQSRHPSF